MQGNEVDVHTVHFHGNVLAERGRHMDSFRMLPSVIRTTDLVADNPGTWLLHCHVRPLTRPSSAQPFALLVAGGCIGFGLWFTAVRCGKQYSGCLFIMRLVLTA